MADAKPAKGTPNDASQATQAPDPYRNYNFELRIGKDSAYFAQCSGLGVTINHIAYREGGGGPDVRQLSGRIDYSPLTLRFGLTNAPALWDWIKAAMNGKPSRQSVSIIMMTSDNQPGVRYDCINAWPIEWRAAELDALGSEVAIETLRIVYERLERQPRPNPPQSGEGG